MKLTVTSTILSVVLILITVFFVVATLLKPAKKNTIQEESKQLSFTTTSNKNIVINVIKSTYSSSTKILLQTEGFKEDKIISLEKENFINVLFSDINNDGYEEVMVITSTSSAPSFGEVVMYTTLEDYLTEVDVPSIDDDSFRAVFERYGGDDIFFIDKNSLYRTFSLVDTVEENPKEEDTFESGDVSRDEIFINEENTDYQGEVNQQEKTPSQINEAGSYQETRRVLYDLIYENGVFSVKLKIVERNEILTASTTVSLSNTSWYLTSYKEKNRIIQPDINNLYSISFTDDSIITASTSCEILSGGYVASSKIIRIGTLIPDQNATTTEKATCSIESELLRTKLPEVNTFTLVGNTLTIILEDSDYRFIFTKKEE